MQLQTSDYGLKRLDGWYSHPIVEWRVGFGGFLRTDDGVRDPGYTADRGGQVRLAVVRDFDGGSFDFDVKHIDDKDIFYTGLPLTHDSHGNVVGIPGIDANFGTLSGPDTRHVNLRDANGLIPLDLSRGTDVRLTQFTAKLKYDLPSDWKLTNGLRYRTSETSRIGLFPNTPLTAASRLSDYTNKYLSRIPNAKSLQLRYTTTGDVFNVMNQNGNGLLTDGSLRNITVPLDEWIDDLRVMRNIKVGDPEVQRAQCQHPLQRDAASAAVSPRGEPDERDRTDRRQSASG
jgi:hypothetical protein